jgi:acyl carrier protein
MDTSIVSGIISIIDTTFPTEGQELSAASDFDSLDFDSLVLVELAVILTREFGVEVTDEELANGRTLGEAAALIAAKKIAV